MLSCLYMLHLHWAIGCKRLACAILLTLPDLCGRLLYRAALSRCCYLDVHSFLSCRS